MSRTPQVEDLLDVALPSDPAVSPDGSRIAYVLVTSDDEADENRSALWCVSPSEGAPRPLTRGPADTAPTWSPDGSLLLFLRGGDGPPQLWCLPSDGGEAEQLTALPLGAGPGTWSPDGTRIAFCAPVDPAAQPEDDARARARRARAPRATDRLDHKADGAVLTGDVRQHLHVLDLATREVHALTHGPWSVAGPTWSPDGSRLAFVGHDQEGADLTLRSAAHVVDAQAPGAIPVVVGPADAHVSHAGWMQDGTTLVIAAATDSPVHLVRLLRVDLVDGGTTALANGLDRMVMTGGPAYPGAPPVAVGERATVVFCARDGGDTHLFEVAETGGACRPLFAREGHGVSGLHVVGGSAAVVVLTTPTSYGEIATIDLDDGAVRVLTRHGAPLEDVRRVLPRRRTFIGVDGTPVHGWLLHDPAFTGRRPLLLDLHGGPHNAWSAGADAERMYHQVLAARGWVVLLLDPRGSDGYGEEFLTGALGAWGEADAPDVLGPVDDLVADGLADPQRLAVAGYSYGGYLTCYLTSRDDRFAAAVAGGTITDLVSMAGTSVAGHLLSVHEIGTPPWQDPERFSRLSPLAGVSRVNTPTLILHGAGDAVCPVGQAEQWHTALRERGVPSRLVLYPGGSHLFPIDGPPSHRVDYNRRIIAWLEEHAAGTEPERAGGDLESRFARELPAMVDEIRRLVEVESPSDDLAALERSADAVAALGSALLGEPPERLVVDGCTHLRWRLGKQPERVLLLGHHDTVWPLGSLRDRPCTVDDDVLRGPGCLDMKAGLVIAFHAVAALAQADGVTLLVTGDEEVGSPTSRTLVEETARECAAVLVLEAAADDGSLKVERKGISRYEVRVTGRAAHAGLEPDRGVNATVELAHQVLAVAALADPGRGTTVTPTSGRLGTTANTVPAEAVLAVDVRTASRVEQDRVDRAMRRLRPVLAGAALAVTGGPNRPPLDAESSARLHARAEVLGERHGLGRPGRAAVGGASDGNLTAGVGTPTLDGLGAVGGGPHAADEHVRLDELPRRTALLAALVDDLLGGGRLNTVRAADVAEVAR